jgi:hypothetical protein
MLPAISIAVLSSYALGYVTPIFGTGNNIYINCRYIYSHIFWMAKLVGAFKDLSPERALLAQDLWF